uniref:SPW repeat-containing integral membrane domain-containing protein n=1 Tax=uncultured bacterium esnapd21 TaxID=1366603 RepID=S5TV69_9BACT|nr:hypothetical protein [uncultured bacterium esnapd21]
MRLKTKDEFTPVEVIQAAAAVLLAYWTFQYARGVEAMALAIAWVLGAGFIILALGKFASDENRQDLAACALGVAAILSPLILGFTDAAGAQQIHVFAGIIVMLVTAVRMGVRYLDQHEKAT